MDIEKEKVDMLIKQGQKRGLTGKDVIDSLIRKGYRPEGVNVEAIKQTIQPVKQEEPATFDRIKTGIQEKGQKIQEQISGTGEYADKSALERGVGATATGFSALSSTLYNTLPETARDTIDKAGEAIGGGINYIADKISNNKALQEAVSNPEFTKNLESGLKIASDLGLISGEILGAEQAVKLGTKADTGVTKVIDKTKSTIGGIGDDATKLLEKTGGKITGTLETAPETIMNKVARVTPKEAQTFKLMTGKDIGTYLTEKGNFNSPSKIVTTEAETFAKTLADKEATLAKLPGEFKSGIVDDVLEQLKKKAKETSTKNVKAPYSTKVDAWISKSKSTGLTMQEINDIKKLFEREVKLGYNKLTDATKVKQATYLDDALRKFQDETASTLGFTNIKDLSKQIQASKFIVDKLGNKLVSNNLLNGVSLTDYIILAGGEPASVGAFLTKKIFSNQAIQAKIAKLLSSSEIKPEVKANYSPQATKAMQTKNIKNKIIQSNSTTKQKNKQSLKGKS